LELSFIDRLVDSSEARRPKNSWEQDRELRASLCRDLTDLLNTRRSDRDVDPSFDEAAKSLLMYGIPDFTQFDLKNSADQERVRISIERAIRLFEPRLTRVKVIPEPPNPLNPALHFLIEARLRDESDIEDVLFDATVLRESRRIAVTGTAG
jgi:type VI secretion system protein ImpF